MKVRYLAAVGGRQVGDVVEHDESSARWLVEQHIAEHSDPEPQPATSPEPPATAAKARAAAARSKPS